MQEDKISKIIAKRLKQAQESQNMPYDLDAWETFQRRRSHAKNSKITWWLSGIAASLLVGVLSMAYFYDGDQDSSKLGPENGLADSGQIKSPESNQIKESDENNILVPNTSNELIEKSNEEKTPFPTLAQLASEEKYESGLEQMKQNDLGMLTAKAESEQGQGKVSAKVSIDQEWIPLANSKRGFDLMGKEKPISSKEFFTTLGLKSIEEVGNSKIEFDFPEVEPRKAKISLGLGVSPSFGAAQQNGNTTASSSLGMGFLVAMDLPGKLIVGSGLGVNLFNQQNQLESSPSVAFASSISPIQEQLLVRQTQLEVPVYFQYPLTTNESVSLQAGFSNFYALSEVAELESSFSRQVPVSGQDALLTNSFQLRSESVVQTQSLATTEGKFYPFATMNFGLNLRVLQSDNTSYILMPFYHLPVNQFTGFGDNPSFFGASFKVRFGSVGEKK
ncbi:hypothetical protein SAMN04488104_101544 [Algoriphagus faecimaris]|uniref:Outer membrane protein beta-barrel domain-containing protein n=1 Tax=Algoriphagus faecimaris TaxID=686796 RepID=A0A1G6S516_9BACT|nr:hypothetical protein [Algoriphagus faecimaris]SDD11265.1 hypothetical protein SAMN04488104_101544 [Algoriphagus faecimaris]